MGTTGSKDYGKVEFLLKRPTYIPGERVEGVLKLSLTQNIPLSSFKILLTGSSSTKLIKGSNKDINLIFSEKRTKACTQNLLSLSYALKNSSPENFKKGEHLFNFFFDLPQSLKQSFQYRFKKEDIWLGVNRDYKLSLDIEQIKDFKKVIVIERFPFEKVISNEVVMSEKVDQALESVLEKDGAFCRLKLDRCDFMMKDKFFVEVFLDNLKGKKDFDGVELLLCHYVKISTLDCQAVYDQREVLLKIDLGSLKSGNVLKKKVNLFFNKPQGSEFKDFVKFECGNLNSFCRVELVVKTSAMFLMKDSDKIVLDVNVFRDQVYVNPYMNNIGVNQNNMGVNQNNMGFNQNNMGVNQNNIGFNQNNMGVNQNKPQYNEQVNNLDNPNKYNPQINNMNTPNQYNQNNMGINQNQYTNNIYPNMNQNIINPNKKNNYPDINQVPNNTNNYPNINQVPNNTNNYSNINQVPNNMNNQQYVNPDSNINANNDGNNYQPTF